MIERQTRYLFLVFAMHTLGILALLKDSFAEVRIIRTQASEQALRIFY